MDTLPYEFGDPAMKIVSLVAAESTAACSEENIATLPALLSTVMTLAWTRPAPAINVTKIN